MAVGPTIASASGSLSTSLPTILSEFLLLQDVTGVARSCATEYKLNPHDGSTKNVNNYGRVLAVGLADGVDYGQAQAITDATTSYSPSEIGVMAVLSGRSMSRVQDPDLLRRTARILQRAYDLKQDTDGVNQLASFTATAIGAAGTVASPGLFLAASGQLGVGVTASNPEPAPEPWYAITHDWSLVPVVARMMPLATTPSGTTAYVSTGGAASSRATGSSTDSVDMLREGIGAVGKIGRITIKADANLLPDASDDVTGAAFSKEGLIFVSEVEATMDTDTPKRLRGGAEVMVFGSYVFGNYRPANYGIPITLDASKPVN